MLPKAWPKSALDSYQQRVKFSKKIRNTEINMITNKSQHTDQMCVRLPRFVCSCLPGTPEAGSTTWTPRVILWSSSYVSFCYQIHQIHQTSLSELRKSSLPWHQINDMKWEALRSGQQNLRINMTNRRKKTISKMQLNCTHTITWHNLTPFHTTWQKKLTNKPSD